MKSKKISNDQELIQSDPTFCPQNPKGNNLMHKCFIKAAALLLLTWLFGTYVVARQQQKNA